MEKRKLGNSGLEVAPLAFGGNVFGWTIDEQISFQLLDGHGAILKLVLTFTVTLSPILLELIPKSVLAKMENSRPNPKTSDVPDRVFPA